MKGYFQGVFANLFLFGHWCAFFGLLIAVVVLAAYAVGAVPVRGVAMRYAVLFVLTMAPVAAVLCFARPRFAPPVIEKNDVVGSKAAQAGALNAFFASLVGVYDRFYTPIARLMYGLIATILFFAIRPLARQVIEPIGLGYLTLNAIFIVVVLGGICAAYWASCRTK